MVWLAADGNRLDPTDRPLDEYSGPSRKAADTSSLWWNVTRCMNYDEILVEGETA